MSNQTLIQHVLDASESYLAGEINLESLISSVELNVSGLEGLVEPQRRQLQNLGASLELAQFEDDDEDRTRKVESLVTQIKDSLQAVLGAGNAA